MTGLVFAALNPRLVDIVEAMWDSHIPDAAAASSIVLPVVSPIMCFHYGAPPLLRLDDPAASVRESWGNPGRFRITGVQTRAARLRPSGAVGCVMVRLRPEAASRVSGLTIDALFGSAASMEDLFRSDHLARLDERLANAGAAAERLFAVQRFLIDQLRDDRENSLVSRTARSLRRDPMVAIGDIARHLEVSERHLSRVFRATTGATPKQFARILRLGRAVASAQRPDPNWAEIALDCGYADQSHMINEFKAMVGATPAALLRTTSLSLPRRMSRAAAESDFYNTFLSERPTVP